VDRHLTEVTTKHPLAFSLLKLIFSPPKKAQFLGSFAKLRKATITFVMSVCPAVRMEQLCSHWKDFYEI
jgi:hypothetical protein